MLVLGESCAVDIPVATQIAWFEAYCELLERAQLISRRAEVIKLCPLADISELSTDSTSIPVSCGFCQKPSLKTPGWYCGAKCKKIVGYCSICRLPGASQPQYFWPTLSLNLIHATVLLCSQRTIHLVPRLRAWGTPRMLESPSICSLSPFVYLGTVLIANNQCASVQMSHDANAALPIISVVITY